MMALTTGLLGGFGHCIGMCGPLVASYSLSDRPAAPHHGVPALLPHLLYNAGRITTYAAIGGLMGLTGSFLSFAGRIAGLQNFVALLAGIVMILMGLNITGIWGSPAWIERHNLPVLRAARLAAGSSSPLRYVLLGLVLGLLPCGLSYTIFVAAAGSGGFFQGLTMAVLFGIGTLPALLAFGTLVSLVGSRARGRIYRTGGLLVVCMGFYFLWRGLQLYARV
jgi:sulfite exporter TauE/SafE